jgi:hypothetical protein
MSDRDDDARTPPPVALAIGAIGLLGALLLSALALVRELHRDEIEHVHAGWLVGQGLRPYADFFEHHHPLLWYASVPVLRATGETTAAVVGLRLCMLALALGTAWATARLGARATGDAWTGRLAATLLVTMSGFSMIAVEVRPDVPQMLLATLACLWLVGDGVASTTGRPLLAGLAAGLAIAFSAKAVLLLAVWSVVAAGFGLRGLLREREATHRSRSTEVHDAARAAVWFSAGAAIPLLAFAALVAASSGTGPYLDANFGFNARITAGSSRFGTPQSIVGTNAVFWVLGLGGAALALGAGGARPSLRLVAATGLGLVALFVASGRDDGRTALLAEPPLAVTAAFAFRWLSRRGGVRPAVQALLLLSACVVPLLHAAGGLGRTREAQLARIRYVLERTRPDEVVYDGNLQWNLFRPDVDYFWFFPGSIRAGTAAARSRRAFAMERLGPGPPHGRDPSREDACEVVRARRPRFVSDFWLDLRRCGLGDDYGPTGHAGLYERRP